MDCLHIYYNSNSFRTFKFRTGGLEFAPIGYGIGY